MPSLVLRWAVILVVGVVVLPGGCGDTKPEQGRGVAGWWALDADESARFTALVSVTSGLGDSLDAPSAHTKARAAHDFEFHAMQVEVLSLSNDGVAVYEVTPFWRKEPLVYRGSYELRNDTVVMKYPDGDGHWLMVAVFTGSRLFRLPARPTYGSYHLGGVFVRVE